VTGPLLSAPPARPPESQRIRPPSQRLRAGPAAPANAAPEAGRRVAPREAADSLLIKRDTEFTIPFGLSSSINQPVVGSQQETIFQAGNWYAAVSTDNGGSFRFISPFTTFPPSPFPFSGGFCCDQRVVQDPTRDLVIWFLSYIPTGVGPSDTNGLRIAVGHSAADVAANTWDMHDITPADFGFPLGTWLDYPHAEASANHLYFTANVFTTGNFFQVGTVIGRIPLAALASNSPYTMNTFVTVNFADVAPVSGASSTMYLGSVTGTGTIEVIIWPDANASPTTATIGGLAFTNGGLFTCPGPDLLDPCNRGLARMQTGWITTNELGFLWHSGPGAGRPYPFVRGVILNPTTLGVTAQPDIWSNLRAYLYPSLAVNARGHLGGVVSSLGGDSYPSINVFIRDNASPDLATAGWELHPVATSTHGTAGRWGDYVGAAVHEKYPNTWLAGGHVQQGGSLDADSRPHNVWFMRERDDPGGPGFATRTATRTATGTPATATSLPTRTPTTTTTPTPSATRPPIGGRRLTLHSVPAGAQLTWEPGQGQTGYLIGRFGAFPAVLPFTGALPADATSFVDTSANLHTGAVCYVVFAIGITPPGISDLLCLFPNSRSPVGGPQQFAIRLDSATAATLSWSPPAVGGQTGYLVYTLGPTLTAPQLLPATANTASVAVNSTTCYLIIVLTGTNATGRSDVLCAIPGVGSARAPG
jgi:hypothetical protein